MDQTHIQQDSPVWIFFVKLAFLISLLAMSIGVFFLPGDLWIKGYFAMGLFFLVSSTIALSKTLRDAHEASKLIARINDMKTQKILKEFETAT